MFPSLCSHRFSLEIKLNSKVHGATSENGGFSHLMQRVPYKIINKIILKINTKFNIKKKSFDKSFLGNGVG